MVAGSSRPAVAVRRGDIWLAALDPTVGSEIRNTRPCLIVSPPELHDFLRTIIIAPLTTGGRTAPYRIGINFQGKAGRILLDQIRTIDKQRLVRRLGTVDTATLALTLSAPRDLFDE